MNDRYQRDDRIRRPQAHRQDAAIPAGKAMTIHARKMRGRPVDTNSRAYKLGQRLGYAIGSAIPIVIIAIFLAWLAALLAPLV